MSGVAPPLETTGDVPVTDVTVPLPVAAIEIDPALLVIEIPEPAVRVDLVNVLPVLLPINS